MRGEAHCAAAVFFPGALGRKTEVWIFLNYLKIGCQTNSKGSMSQQHAKITLFSLVFHWYLKYRNKENRKHP